jgi:hypothetical protein
MSSTDNALAGGAIALLLFGCFDDDGADAASATDDDDAFNERQSEHFFIMEFSCSCFKRERRRSL